MPDVLDTISGDDALRVLRSLCAADIQLRDRIRAEMEKTLSEVDVSEVAEEVFCELDMLDVEELWDRSGPHQHGYLSPDEVAFDMIEETLTPYEDKLKQYLAMGMFGQSKQYCMGVLKGIYQFEQESQSEFKEHALDVVVERAGEILDEWRRSAQEGDVEDMNTFISQECPKWAKWATGKKPV